MVINPTIKVGDTVYYVDYQGIIKEYKYVGSRELVSRPGKTQYLLESKEDYLIVYEELDPRKQPFYKTKGEAKAKAVVEVQQQIEKNMEKLFSLTKQEVEDDSK